MGPWSDGSKEWTPYWLKKLGHTFGDDGVFWMSYEDVLETFLFLHRTRLFDEKWTVVSQWTGVNVSWVTGYLQTKFVIEVKKAGMVVIVLTQVSKGGKPTSLYGTLTRPLPLSSTTDTSRASKDSMSLLSTSSCRRRTHRRANTSAESDRCIPGRSAQ
jgi:hypothetical protein